MQEHRVPQNTAEYTTFLLDNEYLFNQILFSPLEKKP